MLAIEYHGHIWQVSPQLSCVDICQIWMWYKEYHRYFGRIENLAHGEMNERSFSKPRPRTQRDPQWTKCENGYGYKHMCNDIQSDVNKLKPATEAFKKQLSRQRRVKKVETKCKKTSKRLVKSLDWTDNAQASHQRERTQSSRVRKRASRYHATIASRYWGLYKIWSTRPSPRPNLRGRNCPLSAMGV